MARKSFEQAVDRIRQLAESEGMTAFEMGDEALDQCPMAQPNQRNASEAKLAELASASGVPYTTLENRRFVSSRVPPAFRKAGAPWQVYFNIANIGDSSKREDLLAKMLDFDFAAPPTVIVDGVPRSRRWWTIDAIMSHLGERSPNALTGSKALLERAFKDPTTGQRATPDVILNYAFQEATPEAIDVILERPEYRRQVYEGLHRRELEATERRDRQIAADPIGRHIDEQQAMLDLQKWVDVMRRHIERLHDDILPRLGKAPVRDPMAMRHFLAEALADLDNAVGPVRHFVETGGSDIDQFLTEVLGSSKRD